MARRDQHSGKRSGKRADTFRVDPPHSIGDGSKLAGDALPSVLHPPADAGVELDQVETKDNGTSGAPAAVALVQRVRTQAGQLADHLRRQQSGLDHREAEVNARASHLESEVRGARLWLRERQEELQSQLSDLARRERDLVARESRLALAEKNSTDRQSALDRREAEPPKTDSPEAGAREPTKAATSAPDLELAEQLRRRAEELASAESLLAREQADLARACEALAADRASYEAEIHDERRQLAELERTLRAAANRQEETLERRCRELDARRASLDLLQDETERKQRETLQMHLAVEETWARISGEVPPAQIAQSLAEVRLKLADEQRLAIQALAGKRREIEDLSERVQQRHEQLALERSELAAWQRRRQEEFAAQSAAIVARKNELAREAGRLDARGREWDEERRRLNAEIRRLLKERRGVSLVR